MFKKLLCLGLTFTFALSGLMMSVKSDKPALEQVEVSSKNKDDDELKGKENTDEGILFLSLTTFKLK